MGMSQEELDRLTAKMTSSHDATTGSDSRLTDSNAQIFQKAVSYFGDAVRNIVPILISENQVTANAEQATGGSLGDLTFSRRGNATFFAVKEPALTDAFFLGWLDTPLAVYIAKKMMGQEDEAALNEVLLSALNEAFGNIFGAFDASLKDEFKTAVEHSDLKLLESDAAAVIQRETGLSSSTIVCMVPVNVKLGEQSGTMGLLISLDGLTELCSKHPSWRSEPVTAPASSVKTGKEAFSQITGQSGESVSSAKVPFETRRPTQEVPLAKFEELAPHRTTSEPRGIELILDVPLSVSVELGRKKLSVKEILDLVPGSLVELDKLAGESVDLFVNGKLFAKGEVVVIDENFGVRIASIVTPKERIDHLK
jgi:flagellar motor switch protein FliN